MNKNELTADSALEVREYVLEMTPEKRAEMLTQGIDETAIPSVGTHKFRRITPDKVFRPENSKIRIALWIDGDVLRHFLNIAEDDNPESYQKLINDELRRALERSQAEQSNVKQLSPVAQELVNNESFINLLKEKLRVDKDELREAA